MVPLLSTGTKSQKDLIDCSECIFSWDMDLLPALTLAPWCASGSDAGSRVGLFSPHPRSLGAGCLPQTMLTEKHVFPEAPARLPTAACGEGARLPWG